VHAEVVAGVIGIVVMAIDAINGRVVIVSEIHRQNGFRAAKVVSPQRFLLRDRRAIHDNKYDQHGDREKQQLHDPRFLAAANATAANALTATKTTGVGNRGPTSLAHRSRSRQVAVAIAMNNNACVQPLR